MGSKTNLRYHLVLTTKYRRPALKGIEQDVYAAFRQVESFSEFTIQVMGIEGGNHIHLVLRASPTYSIASLVNRIKGMTLRILWDQCSDHLSAYYWGHSKKLWHGAYYCDTTGNVSSDAVLNYVKHQHGPAEKKG